MAQELDYVGIDPFEFYLMGEEERREVLRDAYLDPDDFEYFDIDYRYSEDYGRTHLPRATPVGKPAPVTDPAPAPAVRQSETAPAAPEAPPVTRRYCYVEIPGISQSVLYLADGFDLGVSGSVMRFFPAVPPPADDAAVRAGNHAADRHVAVCGGFPCQAPGLPHRDDPAAHKASGLPHRVDPATQKASGLPRRVDPVTQKTSGLPHRVDPAARQAPGLPCKVDSAARQAPQIVLRRMQRRISRSLPTENRNMGNSYVHLLF